MKADINKLYEVAEDKVHQITGSRPYAIDKTLGLDSLDTLDLTMSIEKFFGLSFPIEFHKSINSDMSLLEIVAYFHKEIEEL